MNANELLELLSNIEPFRQEIAERMALAVVACLQGGQAPDAMQMAWIGAAITYDLMKEKV